MKSMARGRIPLTKLVMMTACIAGLTNCDSDDLSNRNGCDIITVVSNINDTYSVGETSSISVSSRQRNPLMSCVARTSVKSKQNSSSNANIVSFTPQDQLIMLAPGVATVGFGLNNDVPFFKVIRVVPATAEEHQ